MESPKILPTAELSAADAARFDQLQGQLVPLWRSIGRTDPGGQVQESNTLVVLASLTADVELPGVFHRVYEERFLFLTFLLRQPHLRLIYLTSQRIAPEVLDYYLHLLPDVTVSNARKRLFPVDVEDGSPRPLVVKLLERPHKIAEIRALIDNPARAHLVPFLTTNLERELTLQLDIPMYAADPRHYALGSKSGARRLFAEEGVAHALGYEDLYSEDALVEAAKQIRAEKPIVKRLIVKLNEGVSGLGNTVVDLTDLPEPGDAAERDALAERVQRMQFESRMFDYAHYIAAVESGGAVVEEMLEGDVKHSPSVQMRVSPLAELQLLSTHDQMLGGPSGQSYLGAVFPASPKYSRTISEEARKIGTRLAREGVIGRFAVDFLTVANHAGGWDTYAIEINLRKGGTTHPFLTLQYLTDGLYDVDEGTFRTELGHEKYYVASDHVESPDYRLLTVDNLFDLLSVHRLNYDHTCQTGIVLHMFSGICEIGQIGVTAIHDSPEQARALYDSFIQLLDSESQRRKPA